MIPANPISAPNSSPLPPNLISSLPQRKTPWNVSSSLFNRIKAQSFNQPFKLCEVLNSDPEFNFILKYFEHQKPVGYSIKRIVCIHNPNHTQIFEGTLKNMEVESKNPVFSPKGKEEDPKVERARVITRWEQQAAQFSPVEIKSSHSRGADSCSNAKVLPLWHGSSEFVCQSVCSSGFTYFGKQHYFDEAANKGSSKSTDKGYFGSGIYFTNSARYAAMYSSGGHLLLSWVSMREPYPIVNDKPHPQKGSDMCKLEGQKHYQNYNAHFIPVASIEPNNPKCINYYPCYKNQTPAWDEFVVFYPSQALPRFWVELGVDFPTVVVSNLATAGELLTLLLSLLNKPEVEKHDALSKMLQKKVDLILDQPETTPLGLEDQKFLKLAKRLLPEGEKLNVATANILLKMGAAVQPSSSMITSPVPRALPTPVKSSKPIMAFGKAEWEKYFGVIELEPSLPNDIHNILQSPCPFQEGKKVEETHFLTLIPKTVNGKPFTLNYLRELVKRPNVGSSVECDIEKEPRREYGDTRVENSFWILFTKGPIVDTKNIEYMRQKKWLEKETQGHYVVPSLIEASTSILTEYFRAGRLYYSDDVTRCRESHKHSPIIVGHFKQNKLNIKTSSDDDALDDYHVNEGIGAVRKLPS